MLNKLNINPEKQKLIIYIILTVVTLAVYWQVNQYGFVSFDDHVYVTENITFSQESLLMDVAGHWAHIFLVYGIPSFGFPSCSIISFTA